MKAVITACSECHKLNDAYNEAVLRYRLYHSRRSDSQEEREREHNLINEMNQAARAMFAHLDTRHYN